MQLPESVARHLEGPHASSILDQLRVAAKEPSNPMPLYYLADICRAAGDLDAYKQATTLAFGRDHITYQQMYFRGRAKRLLGDWTGWQDFEARQFGPMFPAFQTERAIQLAWTQRAWDGTESLAGKTLLIKSEYSDSDTIQMWRFVAEVAAKSTRVIVTASSPLVPVLRRQAADNVEVISDDDRPPSGFDRFVWLQSLPWLMGCVPSPSIPPRSARTDRQRVGATWYDDDAAAAAQSVHPRSAIHWLDLRSSAVPIDCIDFENVFDRLKDVDFLITIDSPVCHLAASLGLPVYLLLPTAAHWRWGLEDCTPWYPSVRILRQREPGTWDAIIRSLNRMLDQEDRP